MLKTFIKKAQDANKKREALLSDTQSLILDVSISVLATALAYLSGAGIVVISITALLGLLGTIASFYNRRSSKVGVPIPAEDIIIEI